MKEEQTIRKVVFLDTMTLHYIRLCLEYAKKKKLQFPTDDKSTSNLKNQIDAVQEKDFRESLQRGLNTILLLTDNDIQIEYASVTEIEMLTGLVEGKVRLTLAKEGVPYRIWSGFSEQETRDRTSAEDMASIQTHIYELGSMLEEVGVIVMQSDKGREKEVIELAKGIVGLIYMREIDSIIFASAIVAGADCLLTFDNYLRETVNLIRDDQDQRYREIKQKLIELTNSIILPPSEDNDKIRISIPKACRITHLGNKIDTFCFPNCSRLT